MIKKGQLNSLAPVIITLVVAGVFLILGLVILQELRDTDIITKANLGTAVNETLTTVTETGENFANSNLPAVICSVNDVTNASSGTVINSGNYTQTNCNLAFTGGDTQFNNTNWNVTYTFTSGDEAYTSSNLTIAGLGTFASFWEIIVLAIIITIIIGLLLVVFGGNRRR